MFAITEYKIISGFEPSITEEINNHIRTGWQPYGPPIRDQFSCFYQALVRTTGRVEQEVTYQPNYHLLREGL